MIRIMCQEIHVVRVKETINTVVLHAEILVVCVKECRYVRIQDLTDEDLDVRVFTPGAPLHDPPDTRG